MTQAEKRQRATELDAAIRDLLNLHRQPFRAAMPPQAPPPAPVDHAAILAEHRQRALRGLGPFQLAARRRAAAAASASAARQSAQLESERQHRWQQAQQDLDRWWAALLRNDPPVVLGVLADAFEDNEAPATATGVNGGEVSLVALVPGLHTMPERRPDATAAGNLTLRKLTKTERAELHAIAVISHVLRTVREAFAAAPGLSAARIVALQQFDVDAYGDPIFEVMLATRFERSRLDHVQWDQASARTILEGTASELLMNIHRSTGELRPLDLRREPDLAAMLEHIELDDAPLAEPRTRPLPIAMPSNAAAPVGAAALPASSNTTAIRAMVAVAWLLLLVIGLVSGLSTFIAMLGLPLLIIGVVALLAGRLRWAWITNRPIAGATTAAGLALLLAGGTAAPVRPAGTIAIPTSITTIQTTAATGATTTATTATTTPPPSPTTTSAPPPVAPPVTTQPPVPPPPAAPRTTEEAAPRGGCDPSYPDVCIPPAPPDLDCADIPYRNFRVLPPDPHRLDGRDHDGWGCETR